MGYFRNTITMHNVPIGSIKPYENNPRINSDAVKPVAASIREFGFKQPIVVDKDNVIIVGHTRYQAAKSLGLTEVPVIVADDLSPEKVKAYRIADNKVAEHSEWDLTVLNIELLDIEEALGNISTTDFTWAEFESLKDYEDEKTPSPGKGKAPAKVKRTFRAGDVWLLGKNELHVVDDEDTHFLNMAVLAYEQSSLLEARKK